MDWNILVLFKAIVDAQIEAMGMQAENAVRAHRNEAPAYDDQAFFNVKDRLDAIWEVNRP